MYGHTAAMDASPRWTNRCNGGIAAMGVSLQWMHRYNGRIATIIHGD
jgi:hypothetical protein